MKCIIYSAPFVLKKDVYAYEKSLASPKVPYICALKKAKQKHKKDKLLKMLWSMYVILNHCVPCSGVENHRAVHNHIPVPCRCVNECLRATEVLGGLCVCHSKMCCSKIIFRSLFGDNGQNQHITLCYQTPIKQTALFLYTLSEVSFSFQVTFHRTSIYCCTEWSVENELKKLRHVLNCKSKRKHSIPVKAWHYLKDEFTQKFKFSHCLLTPRAGGGSGEVS